MEATLPDARQNVDEMKRIIDAEALQAGERNIVGHAVATMTAEIVALSTALRVMLENPAKVD